MSDDDFLPLETPPFRRPRRRTVPPIIDVKVRANPEPVTPIEIEVISVQADDATEEGGNVDVPGHGLVYLGPDLDPMTQTGSLPILSGTVAAIEEEKHQMERTSAEQRSADVAKQIEEISEWWRGLTEGDIKACMPKAEEYGSGDLEMMGQGLLMLQGDVWEGGDAAEKARIGQELAVLFYIHGKLSRAFAAARNGKPCSDDTIKDIRIYATMLQRIRSTGTWVG